MTINSVAFLLFLVCLFVLYYVLPKKTQWVVLLCASYLFYLLMGVQNLAFILLTTITTFLAARMMTSLDAKLDFELLERKDTIEKAEKKLLQAKTKKQKKYLLVGLLVLNFGILAVLKYTNFVAGNLDGLMTSLGLEKIQTFSFIVPLGISYYTFQSMGYAIDVSRKKYKAEKNIFKFALFVSFFPQITQGPIGRYNDLANQLYASHKFEYKNLSFGLQRILWGFFKKLVLADLLLPVVRELFSNFTNYSGTVMFIACVLCAIQIYADFSGYMDIVAGASEIFGIKLAENFDRPYFSKSIAEYWRRWHITLGAWFRDYMFYPISISKTATKFGKFGRKHLGLRIGKLFPSLFALLIVWFTTGLWHDASWRYILWGLFNGLLIMLALQFDPLFEKAKAFLHINEKNFVWKLFRTARTFFLVCLLRVFPFASTTKESFLILGRIFTDFSGDITLKSVFPGWGLTQLLVFIFAAGLFLFVSVMQRKGSVRVQLSKKPYLVRWSIYMALFYIIMIFGTFGNNLLGGFAYAQF